MYLHQCTEWRAAYASNCALYIWAPHYKVAPFWFTRSVGVGVEMDTMSTYYRHVTEAVGSAFLLIFSLDISFLHSFSGVA